MSGTVAIIIARGGSKGIPNKNIALLGGKPLIQWTIEAAQNAQCVDRVFVSTENREIGNVAHLAGAEIIDRPMNLATDDVQSAEVFLHSLRYLRTDMGIYPNTLVLLMPTQPFRTSADIDGAYKEYSYNGSVIGVKRDYRFHWQLTETGEFIPVFQNDPAFRLGRQWIDDSEWLYEENGALYIVGAEDFGLMKTYWLEPYSFYVLSEQASMQIDSPYDLWLAEKWIEYQKQNVLVSEVILCQNG